MKKLSCKEMGGGDCDFTAEGETNEEVIQKIYAHASEAHPEKLQGMSEEEKAGMNKKMEEILNSQ